MKNIYLIQTDKPSKLHLGNSGLVLCDLNFGKNTINGQHIYITSDEEIKDGWSYDRMMKSIGKRDNVYSSKIILTTDQDLIKDGIQPIDDEFLEWFVANSSCEYVQVIPSEFLADKVIYEIIIPKEEPKQEKDLAYWKENAEEDYMKVPISVLRYITELEERMYSEEKVLEIIRQYALEEHLITSSKPDIWFEQFKKK
jgi:hypothetical protein